MLNSDQGDEIRERLLTKRLQFDCVPELHAEVETLCNLLDCSKREFLDMAVRDAVERAESTFMASFQEAHGQEFTTVYAPKGA